MAITRQVITSINRDGTDMLGTKNVAVKIVDESIVSGSLLTVESNHFCVLKSRGAILDVYETGQYPLITPDKPLVGSIVQGFFGGASPWVFEVIYINRAKLLVRSSGIATSAEMAEVSYVVDYYIHVDSKAAALDLITHLPFNGYFIDTKEIADYAGPAIEQAINQVVQVTKLEKINEHINELRENVKAHLSDFLKAYGITLNDLKILALPKDERMRELIALQAVGLTPVDAVRYYLALRMAEKGLVSAPNAAAGVPFYIGGPPVGTYPIGDAVGLPPLAIAVAIAASVGATHMTDSAFYKVGQAEQLALNLFYGWGYNFYRQENQLRADDLLIRSKISDILGNVRGMIETAESDYRRRYMPPPTREKPLPDPDAMHNAQTLEQLARDVGSLAGQIRALPVPENDRIIQRHRDEATTLARLLAADKEMVGRAENLRVLLSTADAAWILKETAAIKTEFAAIDTVLQNRRAMLSL